MEFTIAHNPRTCKRLTAKRWVFSTKLPASEQSGHSVYNPATSGKVDTGETWSISYGDGSSASGNVYFDKVVVGGTTVNSQAVEAAQRISAQFQSDTANDGLLGLAFDSINTASPNRVATFFDNAKPTLAAPVFTANLKKGTAGNYNFGYVDSSEYTGDVTYVPVNTANGFWEFTANGYAVGSGAFATSSIDAIADTGTTLLYLPAAIVTAYYSKVPGAVNSPAQGGYIFPCSAALPSITLGIGSYRAVVPGSYISYAPTGGGGKLLTLSPFIGHFLTTVCRVLRGHSIGCRHWLLHLRRYLPQEPIRSFQRSQFPRARVRGQAHLNNRSSDEHGACVCLPYDTFCPAFITLLSPRDV